MLTIAIPTYNRADQLNRQLSWLDEALRGYEQHCEVLIFDNCSTDTTPAVIERWSPTLQRANLRVTRQTENVGAIRNIAACIRAAERRFVWTIGDDDRLASDALGYVVRRLLARPDLTALTLNFSSRHAVTGELAFGRCYPFADGAVHDSGVGLFERCLDLDEGGVALTTAQVYRTEVAQRAQALWPQGLDNLVTQIYWTGYCAGAGPYAMSEEVLLECMAGTHFFVGDPVLEFRLHLVDMVELVKRLKDLGYDRRVCDRLVLKQVARHHVPAVLGAFRSAPAWTLRALATFFIAVLRTGPRQLWRHATSRARPEAERSQYSRSAARPG